MSTEERMNFKDPLHIGKSWTLPKGLNRPSWKYINNLVSRGTFCHSIIGYRSLLYLYVCFFSVCMKYLRFKFWLEIGIVFFFFFMWTCYEHKSKNGTRLKRNQISSQVLLGSVIYIFILFTSCSFLRNKKNACHAVSFLYFYVHESLGDQRRVKNHAEAYIH